MEGSTGWRSTPAGQIVLTVAAIVVTLTIVPRITRLVPIPTEPAAWALAPWVVIVVCWILMLRMMRARS
jgi:hypothetical protein